MKRTKLVSDKGFTIVELMIALSVLAVLLVTSTLVMIQIGGLYTKGVNAADLQNTTRNIVGDIASQLQFSGRAPVGCTPALNNRTCYADSQDITVSAVGGGTAEITVYSYCIGDTRYSYFLNHKLGVDTYNGEAIPHVLWRDTLKTATTACEPLDITESVPSDDDTKPGSGYEMMGSNMRLTRFNVQPASTSGNTYYVDVWTAFGDSDLVQTDATGKPTCRTTRGSQFCSNSIISTQITGRVY